MLVAVLVLLPFLFIMFSQGDEIRKLQKKLYEKEQENKGLRVRLGDPFRGEAAGGDRDDEVEPAKFSAMIDGLVEEDES